MTSHTPRWMARRVGASLEQVGEADLERLLVAGALVERHGDHYRIVSGGESLEELAELAAHTSLRAAPPSLRTSGSARAF